MTQIKILILLMVLSLTFINFCYAELNEAEKQVVFYINYLQEMSYTAEYTEGMPKEDVEEYFNENVRYISEAYKISINDIQRLISQKHKNKALLETYKGPTMPTDEQKIKLNKKMKESVARYREGMRVRSQHSGKNWGQVLKFK